MKLILFHMLVICGLFNQPLYAAPAGSNLSWNDCAGTSNEVFACDSNTENRLIVGSFVAPAGVESLTVLTAIMEFRSGGEHLLDWWKLGNAVGSCRVNSLSILPSFSGNTCSNYWGTHGIGLIGTEIVGNTLRIAVSMALDDPHRAHPLVAGSEYYAFALLLDNLETLGPDACSGCSNNGALEIAQLVLMKHDFTFVDLSLPSTRNRITWQSDPTPVVNKTWGAIKATYR